MVVGLLFTRRDPTRRLCQDVQIVGERTDLILLGTCRSLARLALFMAHTAVAATVSRILMFHRMPYMAVKKINRQDRKGLLQGWPIRRGRKCHQHARLRRERLWRWYVQGVYRGEIGFFESANICFPCRYDHGLFSWACLDGLLINPRKRPWPVLRTGKDTLF